MQVGPAGQADLQLTGSMRGHHARADLARDALGRNRGQRGVAGFHAQHLAIEHGDGVLAEHRAAAAVEQLVADELTQFASLCGQGGEQGECKNTAMHHEAPVV
jgi:hypothetical protein